MRTTGYNRKQMLKGKEKWQEIPADEIEMEIGREKKRTASDFRGIPTVLNSEGPYMEPFSSLEN